MEVNLSTLWETSKKKDLVLHLSYSNIVQTKGRCTASKIKNICKTKSEETTITDW